MLQQKGYGHYAYEYELICWYLILILAMYRAFARELLWDFLDL